MMTWVRKTIAAAILMSLSCVAYADPPAESGIVVRDDLPAAWTWVDFDTGYRVILGADIVEFCLGTIDFDIVSFQNVNLSENRISNSVRGTVRAYVFDFLDFDCGLFLSVPPVAYGEAKLTTHDNDIFGNVDPNGANAWSARAHGMLTDHYNPDEQ